MLVREPYDVWIVTRWIHCEILTATIAATVPATVAAIVAAMMMMKLPILPCAEKLELVLSTAPDNRVVYSPLCINLLRCCQWEISVFKPWWIRSTHLWTPLKKHSATALLFNVRRCGKRLTHAVSGKLQQWSHSADKWLFQQSHFSPQLPTSVQRRKTGHVIHQAANWTWSSRRTLYGNVLSQYNYIVVYNRKSAWPSLTIWAKLSDVELNNM